LKTDAVIPEKQKQLCKTLSNAQMKEIYNINKQSTKMSSIKIIKSSLIQTPISTNAKNTVFAVTSVTN